MAKFGISTKILVGYAMLAAVLVVAAWLIHDNNRQLTAINSASEQLVRRRDVVDSLVCAMLEANNAERSVLLGDSGEWTRFDRALAVSTYNAGRLRTLIADSSRRQRVDTLIRLMDSKRVNTARVMRLLGNDSRGTYYDDKVEALHSGRDSVMIRPKAHGSVGGQRETVYAVVKSRRGFFRRLADAFRRQRTDTVGMTSISSEPLPDSTGQNINIADSVANILMQIRREERRASNRRQDVVAARLAQLQRVSVLLSRRTAQLLEDIQHDEHRALGRAVGRAVGERDAALLRIALLGLLAVAVSATLLVYIRRDIRRERRDRQRLLEAKAETERVMQQRERLLLTITHDIKAPAASIAGCTGQLRHYMLTDSRKAAAYVDNIEQSAAHMQQLVSSLLDYHRLESGQATCHDGSVVPARLAENCVGEFRPLAQGKGLQLRLSVGAECDTAWTGDEFRIRQVLCNLLSNAIKYTDRGHVEVSVGVHQAHLCIEVADTGRGMSRDEQQRIFDAFTRLPGAQGIEGVGLGLSIVKETVALLGGTIEVSSAVGHGSVFVVSLPTRRAPSCAIGGTASATVASAANASAANAQDGSGTPPTAAAVKIVVLDDDAVQLQLLRDMLTQIGGGTFALATTQHVSEAVDMVREHKPHVLLTDIEMPEMSACDMLALLDRTGVKVVAMTAHDKSILPRLRHDGFDACLFKPFDVRMLAATLAQVTRRPLHVDEELAARPCCNGEASGDNGASAQGGNTDFFAPLTLFADGDPVAERDILESAARSLDEYTGLLDGTPSADSVARAAHKAMPLLAMLLPGHTDWLRPITPERIGDTPQDERDTLARHLLDTLHDVRLRLDKRLGEM